MSFKEAIMSLY